jgi:hypothetical protein
MMRRNKMTKEEFRQMMIDETNYYGTELDEENNWLNYWERYQKETNRINQEIEEERRIQNEFFSYGITKRV